MQNILSFQQPVSGEQIKEWLYYHMNHDTEYTRIAKRMKKYVNVHSLVMYGINLRPKGTAAGEVRRYYPIVVKCGSTQDG